MVGGGKGSIRQNSFVKSEVVKKKLPIEILDGKQGREKKIKQKARLIGSVE